jgi:RecA/RadA recombinase
MDLYKKILKNVGEENQDILLENEKIEFISTGVLSLNLLFSGKIDGGIPKNKMSMISAPSTLGKSLIGLSVLKNAQKKGMFCVIIDSERSFNFELAKQFKIDISKEKLLPIRKKRINEIIHEISTITKDLTKDERQNIFFLVDSWGGLISTKTIEDAEEGKDVQDMSETRKKNQLANIITNTDSTFFIINHVYDNIGGYGEALSIPGGRRIMFLSDSVVIGKGKSKDKEGDELTGAVIKCMTYKSRFSKEKTQLEYRIKYKGGLDIFYGLLDDAIAGKYVEKPKGGKYTRLCVKNDKEWKDEEIYCQDFWLPIFKSTDFKQYLENKYTFKNNKMDVVELDIKL